MRAFLPGAERRKATLRDLTTREMELLELIAQGRDNGEIAERLRVQSKTVRNHITSIFSKLDVATRAQAIVLARESGLGASVPPGSA